MIAPVVSAMQALQREIVSLETTVADFAQEISSDVGDFGQLNSQRDNTQELCVGSTCVTPAQFQALVAAAGIMQSSQQINDTNLKKEGVSSPQTH